jgi:hypothetical protein
MRNPSSAITLSSLLALVIPVARSSAAPFQEPEHTHEAPPAGGLATFDPAVKPELEVVRAKTGHLLVRPTISGHSPGLFIFDTGAGICVVSTPFVEELELAEAGGIDTLGVGGGENASLYRADSLALGPLSLRDHPLMSTDLSFLEEHLGYEIAGVIGYGVLSRCVAEIDLVAPRIALHDPATYTLTGAEWAPLDLAERIPAIRARFEDHEGLFQLDTGANLAVTFQEPAVRKWKLLENRELSDAKFGGVGGFVAAKQGVLGWIEFGGLRQEAVAATFAQETKGVHADDRKDGSIGGVLLRPFVLVTDYPNQRIAFRKRADAKPATER